MFKHYLHNWVDNFLSLNKHSSVDALFEYKNDNEHFYDISKKVYLWFAAG